ncbi:MAG: 23S rRNA (adenine(2503)-C(2))-methyltransferase RlmN [Candidatus Omnitrophica bacterium]|nr:23S rRNA (adenine(2503)-C(2))-methyltransferase RlmN [Candidatus Omnitrophota bacterium]
MDKKDIKNFTLGELKVQMKNISEPDYRAEQIFFWLYKRGTTDFNGMSNIARHLRDKLTTLYYIGILELARHLISVDKTEKFLFRLSDGNFIETVLIYSKERRTVCLSTQVGCKYGCRFCASGLKGFIRNLTTSEILAQILYLQYGLKHKITNFVFMGMGEPLDNYENVSKAIKIMNGPKALDIAARRITVSTCGIIPGIKKFKQLKLQVNLSLSLHAVHNKLRNELMPVNRKYPLGELIRTCEDFIKSGGRMITLEYILIKNKNDSSKDVDGLAAIVKRLRAKVNLIPYSPVYNFNLKLPTVNDVNIFKNRLKEKGVNVTLRESKGKDIQAACGQLAGMVKDEM